MESNAILGRRDFIARLPRTWPIRIVLALAVAGLGYLAILGLWHGRDLIAIAAIYVLVVLGLDAVIAVLPLSDAARSRMARRQERNARYFSHRNKGLLWAGLTVFAGSVWKAYPGPLRAEDFLVSLFLVLVGLVAMLVWRFRDREIAGGA